MRPDLPTPITTATAHSRFTPADWGVIAAYFLDGEPVRLSMVGLAREDLFLMRIFGPPRVAPRGRRLLEIANGEVAPPVG